MGIGKIEDAKKVLTFDLKGRENGFLTELYKDGEKTIFYLTTIKPRGFKGYHLHRVRASHYVCILGKARIVLYRPGTKEKEEHFLDGNNPQRLFIPKEIAIGLFNVADVEVWLINYPDPPFDPNIKDEQVEYAEEELENGVVK